MEIIKKVIKVQMRFWYRGLPAAQWSGRSARTMAGTANAWAHEPVPSVLNGETQNTPWCFICLCVFRLICCAVSSSPNAQYDHHHFSGLTPTGQLKYP